jgi:hypothetical protein
VNVRLRREGRTKAANRVELLSGSDGLCAPKEAREGQREALRKGEKETDQTSHLRRQIPKYAIDGTERVGQVSVSGRALVAGDLANVAFDPEELAKEVRGKRAVEGTLQRTDRGLRGTG